MHASGVLGGHKLCRKDAVCKFVLCRDDIRKRMVILHPDQIASVTDVEKFVILIPAFPEHLVDQIGSKDQYLAFAIHVRPYLRVFEVGMHSNRDICRNRPWSRCPDDDERIHLIQYRKFDIDRRIGPIAVLDLGIGNRCLASRAPVHHAKTFFEQILLVRFL